MKKYILLVIILVLSIYGCKSENMEKVIDNNTYKLSTNEKITIGFDNGSIHGSGGVNRYLGNYEIKDGIISFSNLGSTMMLGEPEDMDNESRFLKRLEDNMTIKKSGENILIDDMEFILIK